MKLLHKKIALLILQKIENNADPVNQNSCETYF
jgi:hypothetical protein